MASIKQSTAFDERIFLTSNQTNQYNLAPVKLANTIDQPLKQADTIYQPIKQASVTYQPIKQANMTCQFNKQNPSITL